MISEYYQPSVSGTAVGCANFCTFMSSAIIQTISSAVIKKYGKQPGENKFTREGYKQGLWMLSMICFLISMISIAIAKEVKVKKTEPSEKLSVDGESYKDDNGFNLEEF